MLLSVKSCLKPLELLSKDQVEKIHESTLKVLEKTGVIIHSDQALDILKLNGCNIDENTKKVYFPPELVEEMVKKSPAGFEWHSAHPDGRKYVKLEKGMVNYTVSHSPIFVIDLERKRRQATLQDVSDLTRLGDALEMMHIGGSGLSGTKEEIDNNFDRITAAAARFVNEIKNSDKPLFVPPSGGSAEDAFDFFTLLRGDIDELRKKPCTWAWNNVVSPLTHDKLMTDYALGFAMFGLPVLFCPEVMAGTTGPTTLAGSLVQHNAEVLSGVVMCQVTAEHYEMGHRPPVVYGTASSILDPKSIQIALGAPEAGMMNVLTAQMARYYNLPTRGTAGCSDSKLLDAQAGHEGALNALLASLAGINVIVDAFAGLGPGVQANSYAAMVFHNENLAAISRVLRSIEISDETLALDVIDNIGPEGHFLGHEHTLKHFRKEFFFPKLFDRRDYELFEKKDTKDTAERCYEQAKSILEKHEPLPLDSDVERELKDIYDRIKKKYVGSAFY
jgi:trimethylamine--corrinoid protein Co-methyltransferase